MLDTFNNDSDLEVRFSQYLLASFFLCFIPLLMIEQGPGLLANELSSGETIGFILGIIMPCAAAYYFIEFGRFRFSRRDNLFCWRWRNLFKRESGEVPLQRVVKIRRDALEASDLLGWHNGYRLVAILDDGQVVALTRSFSGQHAKKLDRIVDELRDYLGHMTALK